MTHYASGKNPLRCNTYFICGLAVIMVAGFYLTLTSKSSVYKDNTPSSFIVQLRPEVSLKGFWSVALVEMFLPKETELKPKYVTANFIQSSVFGESKQPVLRVFYDDKQHVTFTPEYIQVIDKLLDTLEFEIKDDEGNTLEFGTKDEEGVETGETHLRLHFMPFPIV